MSVSYTHLDVYKRQTVVLAAGDERLSAAYPVEYELLPPCVQLAEHVVEQQHGVFSRLLQVYFALGQFDAQRGSALLALGREGARALAIYYYL